MGITDLVKGYQAHDNDEKPLLAGEFVGVVKELKKIESKKTGQIYVILNAEIINVVKAKEGENQGGVGDQISRIYSIDAEGAKKFANDMFTANLPVKLDGGEEEMEASFADCVNKNVYFRAWLYDKKDGSGKAQSVAIKSHKMLTAENQTSQIPF